MEFSIKIFIAVGINCSKIFMAHFMIFSAKMASTLCRKLYLTDILIDMSFHKALTGFVFSGRHVRVSLKRFDKMRLIGEMASSDSRSAFGSPIDSSQYS